MTLSAGIAIDGPILLEVEQVKGYISGTTRCLSRRGCTSRALLGQSFGLFLQQGVKVIEREETHCLVIRVTEWFGLEASLKTISLQYSAMSRDISH